MVYQFEKLFTWISRPSQENIGNNIYIQDQFPVLAFVRNYIAFCFIFCNM